MFFSKNIAHVACLLQANPADFAVGGVGNKTASPHLMDQKGLVPGLASLSVGRGGRGRN